MSIVIIDYQMGNLRSVQKALQAVGTDAVISDDADVIREADKVILPGVGAFADAMKELSARSLPPVIREVIDAGKPFLGICLGMQLLFEYSDEGGRNEGLGVLPGGVRLFDIDPALKVPHMGWNQVQNRQPNNPLLQGIADDGWFYFVHSYHCQPADTGDIWLTCDYGGPFCAAIARERLFATQFHPEKSQASGLQLLKNFAAL